MRAFLLSLAFAGILLGIVTSHRALARARAGWPSFEERVLVPAPRLARVMSLGYGELAADLAWARTLVYYGEGLDKGSSLAYVDPLLEVVNALDPSFYPAYRWGAYATTYRKGTATQEEFEASVRVLERGLARFPEDWELHWLYGLRLAYDLKSDDPAVMARNRDLAASHMETAMRLPGAPADLALTAASLRTRLGQKDRALRELREMILTTDDPKARARLEARYGELASEAQRTLVSEAATRLERERQTALPFAPPTFYILLGPRPPRLGLEELAAPEVVDLESEGEE